MKSFLSIGVFLFTSVTLAGTVPRVDPAHVDPKDELLDMTAKVLKAYRDTPEFSKLTEATLPKVDRNYIKQHGIFLQIPEDTKIRRDGDTMVLSVKQGDQSQDLQIGWSKVHPGGLTLNGNEWNFDPNSPLENEIQKIGTLLSQKTSRASTPIFFERFENYLMPMASATVITDAATVLSLPYPLGAIYLAGASVSFAACVYSEYKKDVATPNSARACATRIALWPEYLATFALGIQKADAQEVPSAANSTKQWIIPQIADLKCPADNGGFLKITSSDGTVFSERPDHKYDLSGGFMKLTRGAPWTIALSPQWRVQNIQDVLGKDITNSVTNDSTVRTLLNQGPMLMRTLLNSCRIPAMKAAIIDGINATVSTMGMGYMGEKKNLGDNPAGATDSGGGVQNSAPAGSANQQ